MGADVIMTRNYVGAVPGSIGIAQSAGRLGVYDLSNMHRHVVGRPVAMAQALVHAAFAKASGLIKPGMPLEYTGAEFQDFKGTREFVRAHRATGAVSAGGRNIADLAITPQLFALRRLLIEPQAVTDGVPLYANYADRVFEIVVARETSRLIASVVERQPANKDVNESNVADAIWELTRIHAGGYEKAIDRIQELRKESGWREVARHEPLSVIDKQKKIFNPAEAVTDSALRDLLGASPTSPLVEDRLDLMSGLRPTQLGEAPEVYLMGSLESSQTAMPVLMHESQISAECGKLDNAASVGTGDTKGADSK